MVAGITGASVVVSGAAVVVMSASVGVGGGTKTNTRFQNYKKSSNAGSNAYLSLSASPQENCSKTSTPITELALPIPCHHH